MRRTLIVCVVLGLALPAAAERVQSAEPVPRVGVIVPGSPPRDVFDAFKAGLRELGYVDGRNIILEVRWDHNDTTRYAKFAAEFARLPLSVIVTLGLPQFIRATKTVPIVAFMAAPVERGLVREFARPASNVTGIAFLPVALLGKRLQLLKETAPGVSRVVLLAPGRRQHLFRAGPFLEYIKAAGKSLSIEILPRPVDTPEDIDRAVTGAVREGADGLMTLQGPFFRIHRRRIAALAAAHRLPSITGETGYAEVGGLMNHGPNIPYFWRRAAAFVDKILKGRKPADLPLEYATKFELVVNVKTAKALGIKVPRAILLRADKVIE